MKELIHQKDKLHNLRESQYDFYRIETELVKQRKEKLMKHEIEEIKQKVRLTGFNSIFAVSSISFAKLYYEEFKKQLLCIY